MYVANLSPLFRLVLQIGMMEKGMSTFQKGFGNHPVGVGRNYWSPAFFVGPERYSSDFTHSHLRILFAVSAIRHAQDMPFNIPMSGSFSKKHQGVFLGSTFPVATQHLYALSRHRMIFPVKSVIFPVIEGRSIPI